jgi:hypothetical protein
LCDLWHGGEPADRTIGTHFYRLPSQAEDIGRRAYPIILAGGTFDTVFRMRRHAVFDPAMQASVTARAALEADLRQALRQSAFFLHYQPQVDAEGHVTGAEALLRWCHPERGMVRPDEFIPVTEEMGLILPLGHWVLETACLQLVAWAARPETAHLTLAVNVSVCQFRHANFVVQVLTVLVMAATPIKAICLAGRCRWRSSSRFSRRWTERLS